MLRLLAADTGEWCLVAVLLILLLFAGVAAFRCCRICCRCCCCLLLLLVLLPAGTAMVVAMAHGRYFRVWCRFSLSLCRIFV